ncbi:MAG: PilZ domain-containing protein [Chthonomonadales bacterium]
MERTAMDVWELLQNVRSRYSDAVPNGRPLPSARMERRSHPRQKVEPLPAMLYIGADDFPVHIMDISLTGACVHGSPIELEEGDCVVLATTLGAYGPFVVVCNVSRAHLGDGEGEFGVRFMALEQEDTNALFFFLYDLWQKNAAAEDTHEFAGADAW